MKFAAIIPARGDSRRLAHKNIAQLLGKPLLAWTIEAAVNSRWFDHHNVWVSTEDVEIADVARKFGVQVIDRDPALAQDDVWTEPVIQHAVESLEAQSACTLDYVLWMNASVPEVQPVDIDRAVAWLMRSNLREIISVAENGVSHSGVRLLKRETLFQRRLSVQVGVLELNYVDIHTREDLAVARERILQRNHNGGLDGY